MSRVRVHGPKLPPALQGWLLVDEFGVPHFWAAVWQIMRDPQIAESTLGAKLSAVERLYVHAADVSGINLDQAIAALDLEAIKDVMGGFFLALTNHHAAICRYGRGRLPKLDRWLTLPPEISLV